MANRNLTVRVVCARRDGSVWFGTKGGLNVVRGDQVVASYTRREGLPVEHIQSLHEDASGRLWAGCYKGLIRIEAGRFDEEIVPVPVSFTVTPLMPASVPLNVPSLFTSLKTRPLWRRSLTR